MRLVLTSDVHLDRTFLWARPEVARRRRANIRTAFARAVTLAAEVEADALLVAGDLYEDEHVTPDTAAFLQRLFAEAGLPVLLAPGNHDPATRDSLYATTRWAPNVHVFDRPGLVAFDGLGDGVRLWGAGHLTHAGTDGFLRGFRVDGTADVHLALFHGSEVSTIAREGEDKDPHAPFTPAEVAASGLAHAFVGHFHTPHDGEWHTYPGNPDPLTFGESGERAAVVVDVAADGTVTRERRVVAASRVADVTVDVGGAASAHDVVAAVRAHLPGDAGEVRVTLCGDLSPAVDLDLSDVTALSDGDREVVVRTRGLHVAYDLEALAEEQTVRGQFVRDVASASDLDDDERHRVLVTGLRALDGRTDLEVAS
jgi:DNA repair protein SbcD/Mre11